MSDQLVTRLFNELEALRLIDPHSHINPHSAASENLGDILGYHYYTELAHSAGMPKDQVERDGITPKEKVGNLVPWLAKLDNTVQVSWLGDILREFCDCEEGRLTEDNWESVYDNFEKKANADGWEEKVLDQSGLDGVFLTNDFDDPLEGFDTKKYIPCLRTDDLVFKLHEPSVRERLAKATGIEVGDSATLREAIGKLFEHFVSKGAKACAISLPPDFSPKRATLDDCKNSIPLVFQEALTASDKEMLDALENMEGLSAKDYANSIADLVDSELSTAVFWTLAELCSEHNLPFDLMIGVNRSVYPAGVFQGQDLYNKQTSLQQYAELFNAFPNVTFPVSVLDHTANAELVSYSWIFPNVHPSGHWWYSNIPGYIEQDLRVRLEAVPSTKIVGYYSDMYKLEFALPKFRMYRRMLARVLASEFVQERGWSEDQALTLGKQILRGNVESIFSV